MREGRSILLFVFEMINEVVLDKWLKLTEIGVPLRSFLALVLDVLWRYSDPLVFFQSNGIVNLLILEIGRTLLLLIVSFSLFPL
jgi:hypothetical protein